MTKLELVTAILGRTAKHKKTHLMEMAKAELEAMYAKVAPKDACAPDSAAEAPAPVVDHDESEIAPGPQNEAPAGTPATATKSKEPKISDTEKLMLATIPQVSSFEGVDSIITGKDFLAKVTELHKVPPATSRSLMVALKKKGYYQIIGKKSGQKHTTIKLLEKGIQYLTDSGLLAAI